MVIHCYNEKHQYLLFMDIEFNDKKLVQFAGLLFRKIDNEVYQLYRSINQYITAKVCYPFYEYTFLGNNFLAENGVPLDDAVSLIQEEFLKNIPLNELLVISHGLKNDRAILIKNKLNFSFYQKNGKEFPIAGYCTFNNAKRILGREEHLTAVDVAREAGYYYVAHNAYADAWAEVAIFSFLRKLERQEREFEHEVIKS